MTIELEVQRATRVEPLPSEARFRSWAAAALRGQGDCELTIRLVDREESRALNARYRGKDGPTNVLSFPAALPDAVDVPLLGDVVICAPVVLEEASKGQRPVDAHWAHLTIHGILHLLGYDHVEASEAEKMEALETRLLESLGFADPYS
jgi:probable rRNA maturation factor